MRLEERDERLLCDLYLHRFMTRGQIEALYFTSTVRCNARLRQLYDYGFVKRYFLPAAPYGAQAVYSIGKSSVPVVARRLEAEADEVGRQQRGTRTPTFIEHTLEVVNVWLNLRDACAPSETVMNEEAVSIERWLPEMLCRHEYQIREKGALSQSRFAGNGQGWRKEAFKPDAFVRLASGGCLHNFFIEVDLGHTSSRQFLRKLLTHQRYLESGLFQQIYDGSSFRTLVITTGPRRLQNLAGLVRQQNSDLFWLTTFDEARILGILGSIWHGTDSGQAVALLSL